MSKEEIKENYEVNILDKYHDLSNFTCGSQDLDDFLKEQSLNDSSKKFNVTYLIICSEEIIGYFTLLSDSIELRSIHEKIGGYKKFPAIKLGRFGIHENYQGKGLGTHILNNIIDNILDISEKICVRFMTVDAYAQAYYFYVEKNNFQYYKSENKNIDKIDKIIEKDRERNIALYRDLAKL